MKNIIRYGTLCGLLLGLFSSCGEARTEIPDFSEYTAVYLLDAVETPNKQNLLLAGWEQKLYAAYGGNENRGRMEVSIDTDLTLVEKYNDTNYTSYNALPADCFSLEGDLTLIIPDGRFSSSPATLKVSVNDDMELFEQYMLPVTIKEVKGGVKAHEKLQTVYYLFTVTIAEFDRTGWSIHSCSSDERKGEVDNGYGYVENLLDGKTDTYWHTRYLNLDGSGAWDIVQPPHWVIVDMAETRTVAGFTMIPRQNSNNNDAIPVDGYWETSSDPAGPWTKVYTFADLPNEIDKLYFTLDSSVEARYFRLTVTTPRNQKYCNIAEVNAF